VLVVTEAVLEALKESDDYDEVMCDRLRVVLLAPHKHKDREAHKTKQMGEQPTFDLFVLWHFLLQSHFKRCLTVSVACPPDAR